MKSVLCFLALLVVSTSAGAEKAPLLAHDSPTIIPNEYIVVLKEKEMSLKDVEGHKSMVRSAMRLHGNISKIHHEYNIGNNFIGYSVFAADDKLVDTIRSMNGVKYVEHNQEVHAFQGYCIRQEPAEWGLHRTIDRDVKPEAQYYVYNKDFAGEGVDVYIIDTGIYTENVEFGGRAKFGSDFYNDPPYKGDPNGHGTHVAGTVIGDKYGLARKATAIGVRVLGESGSGSTAGVIAGVNWVAERHKHGKKSVANMSLGGGLASGMNDAVDAAIRKGVHFAVAAGNENQDACNVSPASSNSVTVGATDDRDYRSYFSNYGSCVEIFAPGSGIESAYIGSPIATATLSGTSMAAPHVAGVMAKILSEENMAPDRMLEVLQHLATRDQVKDAKGTANVLLYHSCLGFNQTVNSGL